MDFFLLLAFIYAITLVLGLILERVRLPWIFATLLLGFLCSNFIKVPEKEFSQFAILGMYFLLFIIGFEIDLRKLVRESKFILTASLLIILTEGIFGSLLVRYLFNLDWIVCFIVGLSFATVGEAVLVPILEEFRIIRTKLGTSIIGIGTLDDIIEVFTLVLATALVGSGSTKINPIVPFLSLSFLFLLTFFLSKLKRESKKFRIFPVEIIFLITMLLFFVFLGIGEFGGAEAIAALLAGISARNFIPRERLKFIESEIKSVCYGLFAPIFFFWLGLTTDLSYLLLNPLILLFFLLVTGASKILSSMLIGYKKLGLRNSFLLGLGLCVRFSTSLVIAKYLLENQIIPSSLYSVLIASTTLFTLTTPLIFSFLLSKWKRFVY